MYVVYIELIYCLNGNIPVMSISKDRACVDNIFPLGGCEIAEFANRASMLLHRFCSDKVLLTLAA